MKHLRLIFIITLPLALSAAQPPVRLHQFNALQQNDPASCGYHALKNVILIMNGLAACLPCKEIDKLLLNPQTYQDDRAVWAAIIETKREEHTRDARNNPKYAERTHKLDNLHGGEIDTLIKAARAKYEGDIIVMELPSDYNGSGQALYRLQQFKDKTNDMLGIIITLSGAGHWIGVVAYKTKNLTTLYYANSAQGTQHRFSKVIDFLAQLLDPSMRSQRQLNQAFEMLMAQLEPPRAATGKLAQQSRLGAPLGRALELSQKLVVRYA